MSEILRIGDEHTAIYLGDSLAVLPRLEDESVDLIFADPPYNIGKVYNGFIDRWPTEEAYSEWCNAWMTECIRVLRPNGTIYVMTSTQAMPYVDLWVRKRLTVVSRIVWHYDSSGVQAKKYYGSLYEPILHAVKDSKAFTFNADAIAVEARTGAVRRLIDYRKSTPTQYATSKVPGNVWYFPRVRYRMPEYEEHPTQKPEALLERIILASSNTGDVVLDPFAGTFTTCAVAKRLQRRTIGVERDPAYFEIGLRRLELATEFRGRPLIGPQKTFSPAGSPKTDLNTQPQTGLDFDE